MALGDPRQSIYAFRGNDREGLDKIVELPILLGSPVRKLSMNECRRCPEQVVEAANQLMGLYQIEPMLPRSNIAANTHVVVWKSLVAEAKGMARAIVEKYPSTSGRAASSNGHTSSVRLLASGTD